MLTQNRTNWTSIVNSRIWLPAIAMFLLSGSAHAQWLLLDDFQANTVDTAIDGTVSDTVTWEGGAVHLAVVDSGDATNQVMQVLGENGSQRLRGNFTDPANNIASGSVGTLFYRFRTADTTTGGAVDTVTGLTTNPSIGNFDFKSGLRLFPTPVANQLDVRNSSVYENIAGLESNTWYKIWMVADNTSTTAGTFKLYLQSDSDSNFATQTQLATVSGNVFDFRVNNADDIVNVYIRTGGSSMAGSELYYDDFYLNSSEEDLTDPTASTLLLGDVDRNGVVDFDDISPFITLLAGGLFQLEADLDGSTVVDFDDIAPFIQVLAGP